VEDQNNPKPKEAKSYFARRIEKLEKDCDDIRSLRLSDFSLEIEHHANTFNIKSGNQCLTGSPREFNVASSWLNPIIKDYKKHNEDNLNHLESSRKIYGQYRKKFSNHLKALSKKVPSPQGKLLQQYFEDSQYRELYNVIHNFQSLPNFLLNLEIFKTYNICQIFAHEKGQTFALSSHSSKNSKSQSFKVKTDEFNKLFRSIKKSKSKIFYQQNFSEMSVEPIGAFLGKAFNGNQYNLILLIGRNDFLPPSDDELEAFDDVTLQLEPVFNAILRRSAQDDKISNIIEVLESFPHPISITDKSDLFLFKNDPFRELRDHELKDFNCIERELFGKNILRLYLNKEQREQTDLYHFYRVSLLGELLNTLRHELSNPLFGLSLATNMIQDESLDDDIQETIDDIKTNCDRCQTIIKNFSSLYQDEEDFKNFDLIKLLNETIILTKSETKGIKKGIKFESDSLFIFSNPTWISQAVFNLIINSGQSLIGLYGNNLRDTKIEIVVEVQNENIFISIVDNGPGVSDSEIEKLFDPFYTTKDFGTGLGLSICKNLMKKLDGEVFYTHAPNGGAKFTITLPHESL